MSFKGTPTRPDFFPNQEVDNSRKRREFPLIAGYDIECEIGRGGMATVYRAVQRSLNRQVAIKVLWQQPHEDHEFIERFKKEGQTLARLFHPNIITIHDIGVTDNHQLFLAIEYLPGGRLTERIKQGLSFDDALRIIRSIASALGYAHRQGIIHRDVKPANILFRHNGDVVLTDFGIARIAGSNTINTMTGLIIGSPGYMSPEQAKGETVAIQSDLYSLGIIFYEMLVQKKPYQADNSLAILLKHINDPVPKLPKQYATLQPVLNKLLAKKSSDRYQDTGEFLNALDTVLNRTRKTDRSATRSKTVRLKFLTGVSIFSILFLGGSIYVFHTTPKIPDHLETIESPNLSEPQRSAEAPASLDPIAPPTDAKPPGASDPSTVETDIETEQQLAAQKAREAEQEQQRQLQAEQFLEQAQKAFGQGLLEITLAHVENGLLAIPDHQPLLTLREQAREKLLERQQQEEEARRQAELAERRKIEQAEAAQRREKADQFLTRASTHQRAGNLPASLRQIEEGLAIVPDHEGLLKLRQEIRNTQAAEQRRQEEARRQAAARAAEQRRQAAQKDAELERIKSIQRSVEALGRSLD